MNLYSDILTSSDLHKATPSGVYLEAMSIGRPRKRNKGWKVRLDCPTNGRRRNSGQYGAEYERAASWDQHGEWMATLYELDPEMIVGPYQSKDDFYIQTATWIPKGMKAPWLEREIINA